MMLRAAYTAYLDAPREVIVVRDESQEFNTMTVTNAAERVVFELASSMGIRGRRIIYRDTRGIWDELLHDGCRFTGYRHIGARDLEAARLVALTEDTLNKLANRGEPIGPADVIEAVRSLLDPVEE